MIFVIGKDRLRLELAGLDAKIAASDRLINEAVEVPWGFVERQLACIDRAAQLRAALGIIENKGRKGGAAAQSAESGREA